MVLPLPNYSTLCIWMKGAWHLFPQQPAQERSRRHINTDTRVVSKWNVFRKGFPQGGWVTPNSLRFLILGMEEWQVTLTSKSQHKRGCKLNWILPHARHLPNWQARDRIQSASKDFLKAYFSSVYGSAIMLLKVILLPEEVLWCANHK